jgi:hypothetical protein
VLDDGTVLTTLRQAIEYLAKTVPKAEHNHPSVLTSSDHLTRSAERNYPMSFARAATLQAIRRLTTMALQNSQSGPKPKKRS